MGVRRVNTETKRRTQLGMALEQSAKEILAHMRGCLLYTSTRSWTGS